MKFSLANLLLAVTIISLSVVLVIERTSHQNKIIDLEIAHKLQLEEVLITQHGVENMLALARWSERNEIGYHWKTTSLLYVWYLHLNANQINSRQTLVDKHGQKPATKLAGDLLVSLNCDSFDSYIEEYKKMWDPLLLAPNAFAIQNSAEQSKMKEFVDEASAKVAANGRN